MSCKFSAALPFGGLFAWPLNEFWFRTAFRNRFRTFSGDHDGRERYELVFVLRFEFLSLAL